MREMRGVEYQDEEEEHNSLIDCSYYLSAEQQMSNNFHK
jgi:hypothetical protein